MTPRQTLAALHAARPFSAMLVVQGGTLPARRG